MEASEYHPCHNKSCEWTFPPLTFSFFAGRHSCFVNGEAANLVLTAHLASVARRLIFWRWLDCRSTTSVLQLMTVDCRQLRDTWCLQSVHFSPALRWICGRRGRTHVRRILSDLHLDLVCPSLGLLTWLEVTWGRPILVQTRFQTQLSK